tara:strand:+ start:49 stop:516 length:468 start_codon:yes stop_codon:yes gene_type:complete
MNLNKKIITLLRRKKLKLAIAESCTGGMLSSSITSVSGSSKVFTVGLVTYSNQSKINVLKVPSKIIKKYGAVSFQCCLSMLNSLNKITKAKMCVSITGVAGPKGGSKQKPVGLVYIGVKKDKIVKVNRYLFKNRGRSYIQKTTVNHALKLIHNFL